MKSLLPSLLIAAAAYAVMAFGGNAPQPSPAVAHAPILASSIPTPLCDCAVCDCNVCQCSPLKVGSPPDLANSIVSATEPVRIVPVSDPPPGLFTKPTEPAPIAKPVPKAAPKAVAAPQVYYGNGGCANGQCGTRRGLFGRRR